MKKNKLFFLSAIFLAAFIGFQSCGNDDDDNDGSVLTSNVTVHLDVTSWNTWNYFSFSQGKIIGTGIADSDSDKEWKSRTDWDIAFTRMNARTNSGESGIGKGGVIEISPDQKDKESVFENLDSAPASGYIEDKIIEQMLIGMPPSYYAGGGSETINSWLTVSMPVNVTPKVFVMKTADGKYVKVYLKAYQDDTGASGYITMEYFYQPDGSLILK